MKDDERGSCYIWYSEDGPVRAGAAPSPLLAVPNVTDHPSTASVPTVYYLIWHYNNTKFSRHLAVNGWIKQIKKL